MSAQKRSLSIVEAARRLLVSTGVAFTTREVARAAGIAEGTIFRHFATKDDLLQAVIDDVLDPTDLCAGIDALPENLGLRPRIEAALELMASQLGTITAVMTALHPHRMRPPGEDRTRTHGPGPHNGRDDDPHAGIRAWYSAVTSSLGRLMAPYTDQLRVPADQACAVLLSAVTINARPIAISPHRFSAAELADILLNGIADADPTTTLESRTCQESPCS
ncbi:TetR family transcriptional regulator [Acidipropionibacterium jensenii]|uniref:TetR family transcriptional regulator n=2 Tax=Acidipropionibacterium jensenii TaxID=1749 RepID=A0A3Q9UFG0_9ACTN|nr:TetR family transcriptional regulator [Acidipropionibacterium jensenii]